jgi:hypothetical protein
MTLQLNVDRMWNVQAHEAARPLMIYAATSDVTRDEHYQMLWKRYAEEVIQKSYDLQNSVPIYAMLQPQESLSVLRELEAAPELIEKIQMVTSKVSALCRDRWR